MTLENMDCFIAIRIPPEIRMELMRAADALELEEILDDPDETMPHPNSFHITVKYIGEIAPELLHKFHTEVFQHFRFAPFEIAIGEFSVFENPKGDQIVHATVESPELHQLFAKLEKVAVEAGLRAHDFPSFKPHVTIAYVPKEKKVELAHEMTQIDTSMGFGKFKVSTLTIFEAFAKNDFSPVHEIALLPDEKAEVKGEFAKTAVQGTVATQLSDRDRDLFLAILNDESEPNEALLNATRRVSAVVKSELTGEIEEKLVDLAPATTPPRMNFCPHCGIDMRQYGQH